MIWPFKKCDPDLTAVDQNTKVIKKTTLHINRIVQEIRDGVAGQDSDSRLRDNGGPVPVRADRRNPRGQNRGS